MLDEFYWLNKEDPNYSLCRATNHRGKPSENFGKFNIDAKGRKQIMKLFFTANEKLYDKTIEDVFDEHVFDSDFLLCAFQVEDWNGDFSPWKAPAAFGNEDFKGNGLKTLQWLTNDLIPELKTAYGADREIYLIGYSLAGLFALWTAYEPEQLDRKSVV